MVRAPDWRLVPGGSGRDHPDDHPDDPTGPAGTQRDRRCAHLTRLDPTGANQSDAEHPPTDLAVGGSSPSRRALTSGFTARARQLGCLRARSNLGSNREVARAAVVCIREVGSTREAHDPRSPGRTTPAKQTADTAKRKRMSSSPRPTRPPTAQCHGASQRRWEPSCSKTSSAPPTQPGQQPRRAELEVDHSTSPPTVRSGGSPRIWPSPTAWPSQPTTRRCSSPSRTAGG